MNPVVVASHLTKRYGGRLAVDDVSLAVGTGEVLGLLGPNGSGKTTILRMLTGYVRPNSGSVRIADLDLATDSLAARRVLGYVPEEVAIYPQMRVSEFLGFMAGIKGLQRRRAAAATAQVCARLELGDLRERLIGTLSRGYRQRLAIAQALLGDPAVLVLDEPTNGLDPRQIIELRALLRSLAPDHAVILTSHVLGEIERVATRVAILRDGRLLGTQALAGGGPQRLRVGIRGGAGDRSRAVLMAADGVLSVLSATQTADDIDEFVLEIRDPAVAEGVARAVVGAGLGLVDLTAQKTALEALFLELTERGGP